MKKPENVKEFIDAFKKQQTQNSEIKKFTEFRRVKKSGFRVARHTAA
jgi:hypothetical protein